MHLGSVVWEYKPWQLGIATHEKSVQPLQSVKTIITTMFMVMSGDEDMTPSDTTIDYKVSSFLYLHNDKTKNLLLPNIGI